jgi:hypothetical protein
MNQKFRQVIPVAVVEFELHPDVDGISDIFSLTMGGNSGKTTTFFSGSRELSEKLIVMLE